MSTRKMGKITLAKNNMTVEDIGRCDFKVLKWPYDAGKPQEVNREPEDMRSRGLYYSTIMKYMVLDLENLRMFSASSEG